MVVEVSVFSWQSRNLVLRYHSSTSEIIKIRFVIISRSCKMESFPLKSGLILIWAVVCYFCNSDIVFSWCRAKCLNVILVFVFFWNPVKSL